MIQRYDSATGMKWDEGCFVLHTDHAAKVARMEAENAKLREEVAALRENMAIVSRFMPVKTGTTCCQHGEPTDRWCNICGGSQSISAKVGET